MESAPKTAIGPASKNDRRRGNRHKLDLPATAVADGPEDVAVTPVAVTVTHFSVNGVGLKSAVPLTVGSVYTVACFDTLLPQNLKVRVVTRRELDGGGFDVGTEVV